MKLLIVPPAPDMEEACEMLARAVGGTAYDHKLRLLKGAPYVVDATDTAEQWAAHLKTETGLEAWAIADQRFAAFPPLAVGERFFFLDGAVEVVSGGEPVQVPWGSVFCVIKGRVEVEDKKVQHKLAGAGKQVKMQVPFVVLGAEQGLVRFSQDTTDFAGLGPELTNVARQNFAVFVQRVEERAPHARRDDRLDALAAKLVPPAGKKLGDPGVEPPAFEAARLLCLAAAAERGLV